MRLYPSQISEVRYIGIDDKSGVLPTIKHLGVQTSPISRFMMTSDGVKLIVVLGQQVIRGVGLNDIGATVNIIRSQASVMGWRAICSREGNGGSVRCIIRQVVGKGENLEVNCKTLRAWFPPDWNVLRQKDHDFGSPVERKPGVLSRKGKRTHRWYDCIKIN